MLMTEEEAKAKWCPFVRFAMPIPNRSEGGVGSDRLEMVVVANRFVEGIEAENCRCIGSACATWRWGTDRYIPAEHGATKVVEGPPGHFQLAPADGIAIKQGFCGLAGVPS